MSISRSGDKNHFFGKNHGENCKELLRKRNTGIRYSQEINDKKARKGDKNGIAKLVLNIATGIFYGCVREAAESIGIPHRRLASKLRGYRTNNTSFIYA